MGLPKFKIMLHSHLEGHLRHSTIWELAQAKKIDLGYSSLQDILLKTKPDTGSSLQNYLKEMPNFLRVVAGDQAALERAAYEVATDQANQGVLYSEMRLFPHIMASRHTLLDIGPGPHTLETAADAVEAALRGFQRAEREAGIMVRLVLACFRDKPEWADEVVSLCHEYRGKGVVGMDVCGVFVPKRTATEGEEILHPDVIKAFQRAASLGVHRTAHAGEAGPAANVARAIEELRTERIGHGYSAMRDGGAPLKLALDRGIHFELCPNSSYLTGAVSPGEKHPMLVLKEHCASYSLNTDDPTITHTRISDEYQLALKLGFLPDDILESIMLHTHLDGHLRHSTIMEYSRAKGIDLGYTSLQDCLKKTKPANPSTLQNYLKEMPNYLKVIVGDRDALTRVAYEAAVDQANAGVIYSEVRMFAQMMSSTTTSLPKPHGFHMTLNSTRDVIEAVLTGFHKAEQLFGIKARLVLACFRDKPEWAAEVLAMCQEYHNKGVVGMDVCGVFAPKQTASEGEEILHPAVIDAFKKAATLGVHRTAHAGEAGPPSNISRAIEELCAERIGHGYAAMRDGGAPFRMALQKGIHFEVCPNSSYLTGAVKPSEEHPILMCKKRGASFSMSTDDPTITHTRIDDEYQLALKLGFTPKDILESNRNAIQACFLPPGEKQALRKWFDELNGTTNV